MAAIVLFFRFSVHLISLLLFRIELTWALLHTRPKAVAKLSLRGLSQNERKQAFIQWLKEIPNEPDPYRTLSGRMYLSPVAELTMPEHYPYLPRKEKRNARRLVHMLRCDALETFKKQSTHSIAKETLLSCLECSKPFALYLRGFELEVVAKEYGVQNALLPGTIMTFPNVQGNRSFEEGIYEMTQRYLPIVSLANPDGWPLPAKIPKLEVQNDQWQQVVTELIDYAALIIVGVESISSGLLFELDVIREKNKQNTSIIVKDLEMLRGSDDDLGTVMHEIAIETFVDPLETQRPNASSSDFDTADNIDDFPHVLSNAKDLDSLIGKLAESSPGVIKDASCRHSETS